MGFRTSKMPVLQEKSASGSVATFNTALAMPLVNGEFTIQAYQEGSGDPNPIDNIRNIIGWSEVNITHAHKNLFGGLTLAESVKDISSSYSIDTTNKTFNQMRSNSGNVPLFTHFKPNTQYTFMLTGFITSGTSQNSNNAFKIAYTDGTSEGINVCGQNKRTNIVVSDASKSIESLNYTFGNGYIATIYYEESGVFEGVLTSEDFEPYVTPEVKTKALGETVYGGSYNSVTGKKKLTYRKVILDGTQDIVLANWRPTATSMAWCYVPSVTPDFDYNSKPICNILKSVSYREIYGGAIDYQCAFYNYDTPYGLFIRYGNTSLSTSEEINKFLSNNPIEVIYPVIEPIESNIGATPISTNIGNNTIFADTGDVDLTYKDLDIAKRGNFREVFKLPS